MKQKSRKFLILAMRLFVSIRNQTGFSSNLQFSIDAGDAGLDVDTDLGHAIKIEGGWKWKTKVGMLYEESGKLRFEETKESVTGTKEWAKYNYNIQKGCSNGCLYCYACAMAVRFKRVEPEGWLTQVEDAKAVLKEWKKKDGTIMFPTTHDITKSNVGQCVIVLGKMLEAGNNVLVVSKPSPECIGLLCNKLEKYKSQILFRFTIGSISNEILELYEPNAPSFQDRLSALAHAHIRGFRTSVSIEPILDYQPYQVVKIVEDHVTDSIWLGLMNQVKARFKFNGVSEDILKKALELTAFWDDMNVKHLYYLVKDNPKVRWKDSIKKIVGIEAPEKVGQDV